MTHILRTTGCLAAALSLAACGGNDVTAPRIQQAVSTSFANLYTQQAVILGHPGVTPATTHASSVCTRGGPHAADVGPGANWSCMVTFTDQTHAVQTGKFEVNAKANSCLVVGGPSKLIGLAIITDTHGMDVTNPLTEFDACFDPGGAVGSTPLS